MPISNDTAPLAQFLAGQAVRAQEFLGSHPTVRGGQSGWLFRVWAPHAQAVAVMGDFNGWDDGANPMAALEGGVWELFLPGLQQYDNYKYAVHTRSGKVLAKADPYAFHAETRPGTASKLYDLSGYQWGDGSWLDYRKNNPVYQKPMNIYEVHLGSWRRTGDDQMLSYRDIGRYLVPYVKEMGFTHVAVSYTHLDVYKRQGRRLKQGAPRRCRGAPCLYKLVVGELVLALLVILGFPHEGAHHVALRAEAKLLVGASLQLIAVFLAALRALIEKVIGSPGHAVSPSCFPAAAASSSARRAARAAKVSSRVFFGRAFISVRHRASQPRSSSSPSSLRGNSFVSSTVLS